MRKNMRKASPDLFANANTGGARSDHLSARSGVFSSDVPAALEEMFPQKTIAALVYYAAMSETTARRVMKNKLSLPWPALMTLINHPRGHVLMEAMAGRAPWFADYQEGRRLVAMRDLAQQAEDELENFRTRRRRA